VLNNVKLRYSSLNIPENTKQPRTKDIGNLRHLWIPLDGRRRHLPAAPTTDWRMSRSLPHSQPVASLVHSLHSHQHSLLSACRRSRVREASEKICESQKQRVSHASQVRLATAVCARVSDRECAECPEIVCMSASERDGERHAALGRSQPEPAATKVRQRRDTRQNHTTSIRANPLRCAHRAASTNTWEGGGARSDEKVKCLCFLPSSGFRGIENRR